MIPNSLECKHKFGEIIVGDSEFKRALANADAVIIDGVKYLKFTRMDQAVWVREHVPDDDYSFVRCTIK